MAQWQANKNKTKKREIMKHEEKRTTIRRKKYHEARNEMNNSEKKEKRIIKHQQKWRTLRRKRKSSNKKRKQCESLKKIMNPEKNNDEEKGNHEAIRCQQGWEGKKWSKTCESQWEENTLPSITHEYHIHGTLIFWQNRKNYMTGKSVEKNVEIMMLFPRLIEILFAVGNENVPIGGALKGTVAGQCTQRAGKSRPLCTRHCSATTKIFSFIINSKMISNNIFHDSDQRFQTEIQLYFYISVTGNNFICQNTLLYIGK